MKLADCTIGARVYDRCDPRFIGRVEAVLGNVAFVRWSWRGLASLLFIRNLEIKT